MAEIHWAKPTDGDFDSAVNWTSGVPGAADDAILDAIGSTPYTVVAVSGGSVESIQTVATATISITANDFTAAAGTGSGVNAGTIAVADGATLSMSGTLDNTGVVDLAGTNKGADLVVGAAGLTLTGGGELILADSLTAGPNPWPPPPNLSLDDIYGAPGAILVNVDDTIAGAGSLGVRMLGIVNEAKGVIDADLDTDLLLRGPVVNDGLLEATGEGGLYISGVTVDNSSGGMISANGGVVYLETGAVIVGGTLTSAGSGVVYLDFGPCTLDGATSGPVTNQSRFVIFGEATLVIEGAIDNEDQIVVGAGSDPTTVQVGAGGSILSGGGQVLLGGSPSTAITGLTASSKLTNLDDTISGRGEIGAGKLTLCNDAQGVIAATDRFDLTLDTGASAMTNAGLIEAENASVLTILGTVNNTGTIAATGAGAVALHGAHVVGGGLSTTRFATVLAQNAVTIAGHCSLANAGTITAASGASLDLDGATIDQTAGGAIVAGDGARVYVENDHIIGGAVTSSGSGKIIVDFPGNVLDGTASAVTVSGLIQLLDGSSLTLEGVVDNIGRISLFAAERHTDLVIGAAGAKLEGGGGVTLHDSALDTIVGAAPGATLTNVDDHITGGGDLGDGRLVLVNEARGVIEGAAATTLTIETGTQTIVNAGLIVAQGGGDVVVLSAIDNSGTLSAAGTLTLAGAVTGAGTARINGGTLYAEKSFTQNVTFAGTTGVLELARSRTYAGKVSGLSLTGTSSLDLVDIAFSNGLTKATYVDNGRKTGGILSVTDGTHTAHITLVGDYSTSMFVTSSDGHGGATVIDPARPASFVAAMAGFAAAAGATHRLAEARREPTSLLAAPQPMQAR